jgi:hypothetical protein
MLEMIETPRYKGRFDVWSHPGFSTSRIAFYAREYGPDPAFWPVGPFTHDGPVFNLLMASQKLLMAQAVFPNVDHLVITNQTTDPVDTETATGGTTIYSTVSTEEYMRSGNVNPYQVGFNIITDSANGTWGSFCLVTAAGVLINRALAGVTKTAGQGKLVLFTGTVE